MGQVKNVPSTSTNPIANGGHIVRKETPLSSSYLPSTNTKKQVLHSTGKEAQWTQEPLFETR